MTAPANKLPCPGCGKDLTLRPTIGNLTCRYCGETLRYGPDRKLYLANPISRYRELSGAVDDPEYLAPEQNPAVRMPSQTEYRRKQMSIELALDRISVEQEDAGQSRKTGIALALFGLLFALVTVARFLLGGATWIDLLAPGLVSLALFTAGISLVASGSVMIRSSRREEQDLQNQLEHIKGQVFHDS